MISQHDEIDNRTFLKLLIASINNQEMPLAFRQNNLRLVGMMSRRAKDEGTAFKYLIDLIKESKEEEIRVAAAYTVRNFPPTDPERLLTIQNLRLQVSDKKVAGILEEALKRPGNQ